jgi:Trk K+ transport system NAD-binding subunit
MARVALHPQVGGALRVADYQMEEIEVPPGCEGAGKRIEDVRGASVIVAVRRTDGQLEAQPAPGSVIEPGDMLVAIGTPEAIEQLESAFQPQTVPSS